MSVLKFVTHNRETLKLAGDLGWLPGARYTHLRDVRHLQRIGFLDIHWKRYCFDTHLSAVAKLRPLMTVARDVVNARQLDRVLVEIEQLGKYCKHIILVPKARSLSGILDELPDPLILGYSVPTRYGGTTISPRHFCRPVHLLGGRPDVQRALAERMPVVSVDCNRFTLDARFGDYFDGQIFRPHPLGGYRRCMRDSLRNINRIWESYEPGEAAARWLRINRRKCLKMI